MGLYKILWKSSAERDIRSIDHARIPGVIEAIEKLSDELFPVGVSKLKGSQKKYRIRVGDYRIIYQTDPVNKTVTVIYIRHRRDAYRRQK